MSQLLGAPFGGFCDRSDYALVYEQVDLILKLIPIAKGYGTWGSDAEWRASVVEISHLVLCGFAH